MAKRKTQPLHATTCREQVAYAPQVSRRLRMDFVTPREETGQLALLLIHGGGWDKGDKDAMRPEAEYFAARGFPCASVNYRLSDEACFPACIDDVLAAAAFLARRYPRIALLGHSAGGHVAALAGVWPTTHEASPAIAGIVGLAGVYDVRPATVRRHRIGFANCLERLLGGRYGEDSIVPAATVASPVVHVRPGLPPMLLVHGMADAGVPVAQTREMGEALRQAGNTPRVMLLPQTGHYVHYDARRRVLAVVERFLRGLT